MKWFVREVVFGLTSISESVRGKEGGLAYHYFAADEAFKREGGEHVEAKTSKNPVSAPVD